MANLNLENKTNSEFDELVHSLLSKRTTLQTNISTKTKKELIFDEITQQLKHKFENIANNQRGSSVTVRSSKITSAGKGVFIDNEKGTVQAGEIVAVYPGVIYSPQNMTFVYPQLYLGNNYLIARPDDTLIDGKIHEEESVSYRIWQMLKEKQRFVGKCAMNDNPLAVAQFINHSASDANVICYPYDFMTDFPVELRSWIPNIHFTSEHLASEQDNAVYRKSMVFISIKDLEDGEEVLFNYHYRSGGSWPEWYFVDK